MRYLSITNIIKMQYTIFIERFSRTGHVPAQNSRPLKDPLPRLTPLLLIPAALFCMFAAAPSPALAQDEDIPQVFQDAPKVEEKGNRGKLKIDYKNKINFLKEGNRYLKEGDIEWATYCATYALSNNFDAYESYLLFADIYKKTAAARDEALSLERVVANAPNERLRRNAQRRLDDILLKIKSEKIQKMAAAVNEKPQSAGRILKLGETLSSYKDDEGAALQYKYADTLDEKTKSSKYAQIRLYLRTGKTPEAKEQIKNYLALEPDDTQMVYLLAYNGFNIGEIKDLGYSGGGRIDMRKFNRVYSEFYFKNGYYQYLKEKFDTAKNSFTYALQYFSTHAGSHKYLGEIYYREGMFRESREHLKIAYEIIPADYEVGLRLAKVLLLMDKKSEARYVLKGLLKVNRRSKEYAALLKQSGLRDIEIEKLGYDDPDVTFKRRKRQPQAAGAEGQPGQPGSPGAIMPPGLNDPFYNQPLTPQPYVDPLVQQMQYQQQQNQIPPMPPMPQ